MTMKTFLAAFLVVFVTLIAPVSAATLSATSADGQPVQLQVDWLQLAKALGLDYAAILGGGLLGGGALKDWLAKRRGQNPGPVPTPTPPPTVIVPDQRENGLHFNGLSLNGAAVNWLAGLLPLLFGGKPESVDVNWNMPGGKVIPMHLALDGKGPTVGPVK